MAMLINRLQPTAIHANSILNKNITASATSKVTFSVTWHLLSRSMRSHYRKCGHYWSDVCISVKGGRSGTINRDAWKIYRSLRGCRECRANSCSQTTFAVKSMHFFMRNTRTSDSLRNNRLPLLLLLRGGGKDGVFGASFVGSYVRN